MSLWRLSWAYLWSRPLETLLNLLLLALGLAAVTFVVLVSEQVDEAMHRDLSGIDLVVGAKGSPMQLILSGVFHVDVPTGNIPAGTADELRQHPMVAEVIPISLGDSHAGYRIVGTTPAYLAHYGARLATGSLWRQPLEAVVGAEVARATGLAPGGQFVGVHGLGGQGEAHGDSPYRVVGVLAPTGGVLDRLILTSTESVWEVHESAMAVDAEDREALAAEREVTVLLLRYRSPLAAVSLPRQINAQTELQAAAPALETARLLRMVGVGADVLKGFGVVLLLSAGLSVFVGLYRAVRERAPDLAMLRMLGAPPRRVAALVTVEALWLAVLGGAAGLAIGHGLVAVLGWLLQADRSITLSGMAWSRTEALVPALAVGLALLSAALPAWRAYRLDVLRLLQAPR